MSVYLRYSDRRNCIIPLIYNKIILQQGLHKISVYSHDVGLIYIVGHLSVYLRYLDTIIETCL